MRICLFVGVVLALGCGVQDDGLGASGAAGGKAEQGSVSDTWQGFSDYFNSFADIAADHHWFLFRFDTKSAGDLSLLQQQEVTRMCGQDGLTYNPVTTSQRSEAAFTSSDLPRLIKDVMLATADESLDPSEEEELDDQTIRLTIFLTQLASQAQTIWNVSSTGDCQGYWGYDHWVLQADRWTASISIGGGE